MNQFVYEYWSKTELGQKMIASENVSDDDLLFLIPNNVKRMHGLPVARMAGKNKRKRKNQRKRFIESFRLFDLISEIVEETICQTWYNNDFFGQFVDVKNLTLETQPWSTNMSHWEAGIKGDEDDRRPVELCKQKLNELKN